MGSAAGKGILPPPDPPLQLTILELKQRMVEHVHIPVDRHRFIYNGRGLRDPQTIRELGGCWAAAGLGCPAADWISNPSKLAS